MTASNAFSASSFSMSNGGRIVKVTLWRVCFSNSVAMAFAAICVDPTLSTRTSAAEARVDETMSISVLTTIVRKDGRMMSSTTKGVQLEQSWQRVTELLSAAAEGDGDIAATCQIELSLFLQAKWTFPK